MIQRVARGTAVACVVMAVLVAIWSRNFSAPLGVIGGGLLIGLSFWAIRGTVDTLIAVRTSRPRADADTAQSLPRPSPEHENSLPHRSAEDEKGVKRRGVEDEGSLPRRSVEDDKSLSGRSDEDAEGSPRRSAEDEEGLPRRSAEGAKAGESHGFSAGFSLVKFFTRHAIVAVAAYVMMVRLHLEPLGMLAGVSSLGVAVAVESFRDVRWRRFL